MISYITSVLFSVDHILRELSRRDFGGFCDEINEVPSVSFGSRDLGLPRVELGVVNTK